MILYTVLTDKGEGFEEGKVPKDKIASFEKRSNSLRKVSIEKQSTLPYYIFFKISKVLTLIMKQGCLSWAPQAPKYHAYIV